MIRRIELRSRGPTFFSVHRDRTVLCSEGISALWEFPGDLPPRLWLVLSSESRPDSWKVERDSRRYLRNGFFVLGLAGARVSVSDRVLKRIAPLGECFYVSLEVPD